MLNYYNHITINHVETGMLFLYYWQKPKKLKTVIGETVNSIIDGQSNTKEKMVDKKDNDDHRDHADRFADRT